MPDTPQSVEWMNDGAPFSRHFNDRYHSYQDGGVSQAIGSFLHGCGLPEKWQHQKQWRILETGFGMGLNFLVTWQAWRDDPLRCERLHFISTEAYPVSAQALVQTAQNNYPHLLPLAEQLASQYVDMHSGIHRLSFEGGRVELTLAIGDAKTFMREQGWRVDSIYLDGFSPQKNPEIWDEFTLKAAAKCSIAGHTTAASWCIARSVRDTLTRCGFEVERIPGIAPKRHNLRATYAPHWHPNTPEPVLAPNLLELCHSLPAHERKCTIIGAGLAGAHIARQLAERHWQVTVLDQHAEPALGASALPVGLFAPHITPDDAPLSQLTRAGIKATRRMAQFLHLNEGLDWGPTGVLEHRVGKKSGLPFALPTTDHSNQTSDKPHTEKSSLAIAPFSSVAATEKQRALAGIGPSDAPHSNPAIWHMLAGWIKPRALIHALLKHPNIQWKGCCKVAHLSRTPPGATPDTPPNWQAFDQSGALLASAPLMIVACAFESQKLIAPWQESAFALNAVRGQVAFGTLPHDISSQQLPAFPVNGKGSFIHIPHAQETGNAPLWISAGTFERDRPGKPTSTEKEAALQENKTRLSHLMPLWGEQLAEQLFTPTSQTPVRTWSAQRCTVIDRTPLMGPVSHTDDSNGLLIAAGLGSRGLTLAALSAEILVALLHEEPLPVEKKLAKLVLSSRMLPHWTSH